MKLSCHVNMSDCDCYDGTGFNETCDSSNIRIIGPTNAPTELPTIVPTVVPTFAPTAPTAVPSGSPSQSPTMAPSAAPTLAPSESPTMRPTNSPSDLPTQYPSFLPTKSPSTIPTFITTESFESTENEELGTEGDEKDQGLGLGTWQVFGHTFDVLIC